MIELTKQEVAAIKHTVAECQYSYPALDTAYDKLHTWVDDAVILTRKEYERLCHEAAAHSLKHG